MVDICHSIPSLHHYTIMFNDVFLELPFLEIHVVFLIYLMHDDIFAGPLVFLVCTVRRICARSYMLSVLDKYELSAN